MNSKTPNSALNRLNIEGFKDAEKNPVYVILDNVRSAQNVGSIFRSMDAFRCAGLFLCGITSTPPHREIQKTALGATATVPWQYFDQTIEAMNHIRSMDSEIFAVEQAADSLPLHDFKMPEGRKIAFILGNEVSGVSQEAIDLADGCIEIPQFGTKHSLNVSVCAGIVLWQSIHQMHRTSLQLS